MLFCWENKSSTTSQRNCSQKEYWTLMCFIQWANWYWIKWYKLWVYIQNSDLWIALRCMDLPCMDSIPMYGPSDIWTLRWSPMWVFFRLPSFRPMDRFIPSPFLMDKVLGEKREFISEKLPLGFGLHWFLSNKNWQSFGNGFCIDFKSEKYNILTWPDTQNEWLIVATQIALLISCLKWACLKSSKQ